MTAARLFRLPISGVGPLIRRRAEGGCRSEANALDVPPRMPVRPLRSQHHPLHLTGRYTHERLLHGDDCVTSAARKRADQECGRESLCPVDALFAVPGRIVRAARSRYHGAGIDQVRAHRRTCRQQSVSAGGRRRVAICATAGHGRTTGTPARLACTGDRTLRGAEHLWLAEGEGGAYARRRTATRAHNVALPGGRS
jgi:hypothetical protein